MANGKRLLGEETTTGIPYDQAPCHMFDTPIIRSADENHLPVAFLERFRGGTTEFSVAAKKADKQIDADRRDNATRRAYWDRYRIGDLQYP